MYGRCAARVLQAHRSVDAIPFVFAERASAVRAHFNIVPILRFVGPTHNFPRISVSSSVVNRDHDVGDPSPLIPFIPRKAGSG